MEKSVSLVPRVEHRLWESWTRVSGAQRVIDCTDVVAVLAAGGAASNECSRRSSIGGDGHGNRKASHRVTSCLWIVCGPRTSAARRLCATFNKMEGNRALARYLEAEFSGADMALERFRLTTALRRTAVRVDANPLQTVSICGSSNRLRSSEVKRQGRVSASKSCLSTPARK